jgi:hypothetical protein
MGCGGSRLSVVEDVEGSQWCARVINGSSQYNSGTWGYRQAAGQPHVYPRYGDIHGAWAPRRARGDREWIELEFEREMCVGGIEIFETFNPGAVVAVKVKRSLQASWEVAWEGTAERGRLPARSRIFSPALFHDTSSPVRYARLELDTSGAGSWSEIDAVRLLPQSAEPVVAAPVVVATVLEGNPAPWSSSSSLSGNASVRPLHEIVSMLKRQLALDGTMFEVIDHACRELGVEREGKSLMAAAEACEDALHGGAFHACHNI